MRMTSSLARRLFLAFALLIGTFVLASGVTLRHFRDVDAGLQQMREEEDGIRLALALASAVRDQYAHQAHTIILRNDSHVPYYRQARERVGELTRLVRQHARTAEEQEWVTDIERASDQLDEIFRTRILPAVLAQDERTVLLEHERAQRAVSLIENRADRLVERFGTSIAAFHRHVRGLQAAAFRWSVFFIALALLLAVGVGGYLLRSVARPVRQLSEGAARLARGDLDTRIPIETSDELGALAQQFNAMTEAIGQHQRTLVEAEKLAGIGRLAAGVAHEINNPLAVILGYARLLERKLDGASAEDVRVIRDETLRAKGIVDGLLELARPMPLACEAVDLRELCEDAVARLTDADLIDDVRVTISGAGIADAEPNKLRQVVVNLLQNAVEAAGQGGRVDVEIASTPAGSRIVVTDSGPGLSADARMKLFEPFFTTKPDGTGLGLAVSRGIVRAHGGDIQADEAPGGGGRFTVSLPSPLRASA
jgi:two-component system NtrC family sensor kinase